MALSPPLRAGLVGYSKIEFHALIKQKVDYANGHVALKPLVTK